MRRIQLSDMVPHVHSFLPNESKTEKLSKWLIGWIVISLQKGEIQPYDLLPAKGELACHIGVSLGTMQNVYRILEDAGYIESKQKIGSYIKNRKVDDLEKLTSKKDLATDVIKKYLKDNKYKVGDKLISTRKLAEITGISVATLRAALTNLVLQGIFVKEKNSYILTGRSFKLHNIEAKTLVEKVSKKIKKYINDNYNEGDKIPPGTELAEKFNVSIKTIHDSIKLLSKEGLLYTRRGQYGTIVLGKNPDNKTKYNYEEIERKIKTYIISNNKVGDKLPSIKNFSKKYKTSEKTVKKALDNLSEDGYITFSRGRYGGTYVVEIPSESKDAYAWIAINSEYVSKIDN